MRRRSNRSCTYAVALDAAIDRGGVQALANYLTTLSLADCEVIVFDPSFFDDFEERHCVLRWVARHVVVLPHHRLADGTIDLVQAAAETASTEKIIIASTDARYTSAEVRAMCELLERHELVEPEEYVSPMPWWGGLDAGRLLLHRGIEQTPPSRSTFAFRRAAYRPLHGFDDRLSINHPRRLAGEGTEIHEARGLFVRREPPAFTTWLRTRARDAAPDLVVPVRSAFFLAIVPLIVLLAVMGGVGMAGSYAGVMAAASVMLAARGRTGAGKFFPVRACLFAPLWIVERSLSMYLALFDRVRGVRFSTAPSPSMRANARVASGE